MRTGNKRWLPHRQQASIVISCLIAFTLGAIFFHTKRTLAVPNTIQSGINLSLLPDSPTVKSGSIARITIFAHPNGSQLAAAKLSLNYNPQKFEATAGALIPGEYLSQILPNCDIDALNCPAASQIDPNTNTLTAYLGVGCTESGCTQSPTNQPFALATLEFKVLGEANSVETFSLLKDNLSLNATQLAALNNQDNVLGDTKATNISISLCQLIYDFLPDNQVNIIDLQQANSHWNTSALTGDYNGQFDINKDHQINILDIQQVASKWGSKCQ